MDLLVSEKKQVFITQHGTVTAHCEISKCMDLCFQQWILDYVLFTRNASVVFCLSLIYLYTELLNYNCNDFFKLDSAATNSYM